MKTYKLIDKVAIHDLFGTGKDIYWYGILISIGVICALLFAVYDTRKRKLHSDLPYDMALVAVISALIGARLYYVIFDTTGAFKDNFWEVFAVWDGGLAIFGGVIGGAIGLYFYSRRKKLNLFTLFDIAAPGLVLGQAIGRWGNFINQEAFGHAVTNPSMQWFPFAVYIQDTNSGFAPGWYQATFFYESMWCFLLFLFLFFYRKRQKFAGEITLLYFGLYSIERAFVELLRTDQLKVLGLPVSHLLSDVLVVGATVALVICYKKYKEGKLSPVTPGSIYYVPKEEPAAAEAEEQSVKEKSAGKITAAKKVKKETENDDDIDTEL